MKMQHRALAVVAGLAAFALAGTGAARGQLITGETDTASSNIPGFDRGQAHAVDDSGLSSGGDNTAVTPDQTHTAAPDGFMWLSRGNDFGGQDLDPFYLVDLGNVYDVTAIRVFNYNEAGAFALRGVQAGRLLVSETAPPTTADPGGLPVVIPVAPGTNDYTGVLLFNDAAAPIRGRYFMLDIDSNYGGDNNFYGLSEVQFDGTVVPEPAGLSLLAVAGLAALRRRRRVS